MKYLIANYSIEGFENSTIGELKQWASKRAFICLDTEARRRGESNLKFDLHDMELISVQIGDKWDQWFIDVTERAPDLHWVKGKIVVGHNIKFDYQILKLELGIELERVYDTMLGEYVLNTGLTREKGFYSLESTYYRYFQENPYGNQLSLWDPWIPKNTRNNIQEITREVAFYGCTDIITTWKVMEAQNVKITEEQLNEVLFWENRFVLVLGDMELEGMPIDVDRWLELDEWTGERLEETKLKLWELYPEVENWNSSKQVGALFKKLGINIINKDKKESVNELVIASQAKEYPIITDYLEYKKFSKLKSTYGLKFLKHVSSITDRIHSSFIQILNTGRCSSTSPNLQNIISGSEDFPEGHEWRKAFKAPKGRTFVIADYGS